MTTITQRPARAWAAGHRALLALVSLVVAAAIATVVTVLATTSQTRPGAGTAPVFQHVEDTCNEVGPGHPC